MASQGTGARSFYGRLTRRRLNLHLKVISVLNRQSVQTFRHIIGTVANGRTDGRRSLDCCEYPLHTLVEGGGRLWRLYPTLDLGMISL